MELAVYDINIVKVAKIKKANKTNVAICQILSNNAAWYVHHHTLTVKLKRNNQQHPYITVSKVYTTFRLDTNTK